MPGDLLCDASWWNQLTNNLDTSIRCFNPFTHVCARREGNLNLGNFLCPLHTPKLCGNDCYNDSLYSCMDNLLYSITPVQGPEPIVQQYSSKQFQEQQQFPIKAITGSAGLPYFCLMSSPVC